MTSSFREYVCPRCAWRIRVSASDTRPPQCDGPGCTYEFSRHEAAPQAVAPKRPASPPPSNPRLVAPHVCPKCAVPITEPAGTRRRTIDHVCGNRTDLFAVLFRAPCCCTFVEMPLARAGQEVECPACPRTFRGPRDDILHRLSGDVRAGQLMAFLCPNHECGTPLQANTHVDGKPVSGEAVVCPACLNVFAMPSAGMAVRRSP